MLTTCRVCGVRAQVKPENLQRIEAKAAPKAKPPTRGGGAASTKGSAAAAFVSAGSLAAADWWEGQTHEACYKWFIDAFMLRVEDEYTHGGGTYGAYSDATGCYDDDFGSCAARDLCAFIESAIRVGAVPPWWDAQDCVAHASGVVCLAVEAHDMAEKHGPLGVLALRVLANRITGGPPGGDAGLGKRDHEDEEDEYDEDEDWEGNEDEWNADEEGGDAGLDEDEDDQLWDKGEDEEQEEEEPACREARLLEQWTQIPGDFNADEAAAFAAALAVAQRTPPRCVVLTGLAYMYDDDERQANTFDKACGKSVQYAMLPMAPPGAPALIESCKASVRAALPRAACLVVLQAEAAGAGRVLPSLRGALRAWVAAGGVLAVNGGRDAVSLLRHLFPEAVVGWAMSDDCEPDDVRPDAVLNEECAVLLAPSPPELPPRVGAGGFLLTGVQPVQQVYVPALSSEDEPALCGLALASSGKGRVIFFSDVEGKDAVAVAVLALALHGLAEP